MGDGVESSGMDQCLRRYRIQFEKQRSIPTKIPLPIMLPRNRFTFSNKQASKNRHRSREYPES